MRFFIIAASLKVGMAAAHKEESIEKGVVAAAGKAVTTAEAKFKESVKHLTEMSGGLETLHKTLQSHIKTYTSLVKGVILAEHAGNRKSGQGAVDAHGFIATLEGLDSQFEAVVVQLRESLNGLGQEKVQQKEEEREERERLKPRGYMSHSELLAELVKALKVKLSDGSGGEAVLEGSRSGITLAETVGAVNKF